MEILQEPILNYVKIISKKYNMSFPKIKLLVDRDWTFTINDDISKETLYTDVQGNKYIIIDKNTGLKLLY